MRLSVGVRVALFAFGVTSPLFAQAPAEPEAPGRSACVTSHVRSQELRLDSKLLQARDELRVCANAACPSPLRAECASWLAEVEQQIPSVVVSATVDGQAPAAVAVAVDGKPLTERLDDTVYELNPGAHTFRFEVEGQPAHEEVVVLRQYEKRRLVRAQFSTAVERPEPAPGPQPVGGVQPAPLPEGVRTRPIPAAAWMFGGIAVGAAAAGIYLGVDGLQTHSDKEDSCSPTCSDSDVRKLKSQLLLADIAGGVAVLSAGIAVYMYLTRPEVVERPPSGWANRIRVGVAPGGASVLVNSTF